MAVADANLTLQLSKSDKKTVRDLILCSSPVLIKTYNQLPSLIRIKTPTWSKIQSKCQCEFPL